MQNSSQLPLQPDVNVRRERASGFAPINLLSRDITEGFECSFDGFRILYSGSPNNRRSLAKNRCEKAGPPLLAFNGLQFPLKHSFSINEPEISRQRIKR